MMSFSLNSTVINPTSKQNPKNAVILCHGFGGDGKDISILANYWKNFLKETIFICPDGPEKCAVSPTGYQWFDLMHDSKDQILTKSLVAEIKLNKLIDEVKKEYNLESKKIALGGFSQGCMITLQTGLKREDSVNCILGYSGRIIDTNHLAKNLNSKPEILLMHGDKDDRCRLGGGLTMRAVRRGAFMAEPLDVLAEEPRHRQPLEQLRLVCRRVRAQQTCVVQVVPVNRHVNLCKGNTPHMSCIHACRQLHMAFAYVSEGLRLTWSGGIRRSSKHCSPRRPARSWR